MEETQCDSVGLNDEFTVFIPSSRSEYKPPATDVIHVNFVPNVVYWGLFSVSILFNFIQGFFHGYHGCNSCRLCTCGSPNGLLEELSAKFVHEVAKQVDSVYFHHSCNNFSNGLGVRGFVLEDPGVLVLLCVVCLVLVGLVKFSSSMGPSIHPLRSTRLPEELGDSLKSQK